jgi:hypothetical protein
MNAAHRSRLRDELRSMQEFQQSVKTFVTFSQELHISAA